MYLRHWVILSLFGECAHAHTHTHTRNISYVYSILCVTSALSTWNNDPNKRLRETRSRKKRICDVKPTKNLFGRKKSSYHMLSDWCYTMGLYVYVYTHCHSYFVDWLTFILSESVCAPIWSFIRLFVRFFYVKTIFVGV